MSTNETRLAMDVELASPEAGRDAEQTAKEMLAHGLLQSHYRETAGDTERRVSRLLEAIDAEERARRVSLEPAPAMSFAAHAAKASRWRSLRFATGLAAAMTLVAVLAIEFTPTNSALAAVQASVEASKSAGDRRYSVKVQPQKDKGDEFTQIGTLDVRDPEHVVIQAKTPQGHRITVGRSPDGVWAIRPDGTIDRYAPKSAMPRWVNFGSNSIVLESVDDLMKQLAKDYTLTRGEPEALGGAASSKLERLTAKIKLDHTGPEPERVEIWMDSTSRVVKRLELHWPEFAGRGAEKNGEGPDVGERRGLPADGPALRMRGPGGPRPGGRGEGDEEPRGDRRGPDGNPEGAMPHEGDEMQPGEGPRAEEDGGAEGERRPHRGPGMGPEHRMPRDGEIRGPRGAMGPGGPDGLRGLGGAREGRGPFGGPMGGPPEFLRERPDFRRGGAGGPPPPPRVMVFELEEGAVFAEGWFEPEAHGEK